MSELDYVDKARNASIDECAAHLIAKEVDNAEYYAKELQTLKKAEPKPQIGPDVPVMCDYSGHDNAVFRGPDGLPSSATNIRTLIPEDKVTGWMRELVRAAAGENRVDMVAACARVEGKIAAYRRGE